jgi:hypothetical protein
MSSAYLPGLKAWVWEGCGEACEARDQFLAELQANDSEKPAGTDRRSSLAVRHELDEEQACPYKPQDK